MLRCSTAQTPTYDIFGYDVQQIKQHDGATLAVLKHVQLV
jgi:ABC-type transporter Mla MlaB component